MSFWINYTGRQGEYPLPDGATNRVRLNMTQPKLTANKGAAEIRHEIIRKMDRLEQGKDGWTECWIKLRKFINGMAKRASAKKGGLGRK